MNKTSYEHHSHNFSLNLSKENIRATDRFSRSILLLFVIFGLMLCLLGLFYFIPELLTGTADIEKGMPKLRSSLTNSYTPAIFNGIIFLTGVGIIIGSIIKGMTYKKIFFDGENFTIRHRPLFGDKKTVTENLYNYLGVRLRVKFYQFGIISKNKFIIELYHEDPEKIVPLYITTQKKGIRNIWQEYAQKLHMHGITMSDQGMVSHNFKDMEEPYVEVVKKWHLPKSFVLEHPKPEYILLKSNSKGEKLIKFSESFFDAHSFLRLGIFTLLTTLLIYLISKTEFLLNFIPLIALYSFYALLITLCIYLLCALVAKDIIIIANNKIYIFRKILFTRYHGGAIPFGSIKGIDINYTPTSERYYLSIVTAYNNYIVGDKIPVEGLRWLRSLLIHEIIGN